jgi:hypothetical protein
MKLAIQKRVKALGTKISKRQSPAVGQKNALDRVEDCSDL